MFDFNATSAQEKNVFDVQNDLFVNSYGFLSFEILPLACLPHVANKVLLSDHKVENASKGSWSCNKNGLLL